MSLSTDAIGRSGFPQMWPYFIFHGGSCMPSHSVYLSPYFKRKDDPAIDCMWNSGRFMGCMVFYMVLANFGLSLQTTMSSILFPYLTNKGEALSFLVTGAATRKSGVFGCFWGYSIISYITGHCTVGYALGFATQKGQIVRVNRHSGTWHFG